ncbi:MAG TPA: 50S ribosomal protein L35 [Actinomycetota bacterium]|nr:50S ribosomal protein L35 [Actinomycetota bacterium]
MPKMKTHRGAAKRFRVTGGGKVLHRKATGNHMLIKKSSSRKRRITGMAEVQADNGSVRRMLGGSRNPTAKRSPAP